METQICRECGYISKPSKALLNQLVSFDDFGNDAGKRGTTQSRHGEAKEVDCLKCPNCGHSWIPEKSDREKAIEWWNSFNGKLKQINLIIKHIPDRPKSLKLDNITEEEIEQIWRKEVQQTLREDEDCYYPRNEHGVTFNSKQQVDFEMLSSNLMYITEHCKNSSLDKLRAREITKNLLLFFDLLSKSSTFAHKAHKELNKLMK